MPDWSWLLRAAESGEALPDATILAIRLALAALSGFVVAGIHALTLGRTRENSGSGSGSGSGSSSGTLPTTLVLLSILIAVVTVVIGDNMARAFGLVGALSIVRFRTVVEDTRDTAFVIFAVAVGMAVGAGHAILVLLSAPAVLAASLIMNRLAAPRGPSASLVVRIGLGVDADALFAKTFADGTVSARLAGVVTVKQGAALEMTYAVILRGPEHAVPLLAELNRIEGVQSVELRW